MPGKPKTQQGSKIYLRQSQTRAEICGLLGANWIPAVRAVRKLGFYFPLFLRMEVRKMSLRKYSEVLVQRKGKELSQKPTPSLNHPWFWTSFCCCKLLLLVPSWNLPNTLWVKHGYNPPFRSYGTSPSVKKCRVMLVFNVESRCLKIGSLCYDFSSRFQGEVGNSNKIISPLWSFFPSLPTVFTLYTSR